MNVIDVIQSVVANRYDISVGELVSMRRSIRLVLPRHMAMALAKQMTRKSDSAVGRKFGDRDRASIVYAVRKIENQAETDAFMREELELIEQQVRLSFGLPEKYIVREMVEVPVPSPVQSEIGTVVAAFNKFENDKFTRGEASAWRNLEHALNDLRTAHHQSNINAGRNSHDQ